MEHQRSHAHPPSRTLLSLSAPSSFTCAHSFFFGRYPMYCASGSRSSRMSFPPRVCYAPSRRSSTPLSSLMAIPSWPRPCSPPSHVEYERPLALSFLPFLLMYEVFRLLEFTMQMKQRSGEPPLTMVSEPPPEPKVSFLLLVPTTKSGLFSVERPTSASLFSLSPPKRFPGTSSPHLCL